MSLHTFRLKLQILDGAEYWYEVTICTMYDLSQACHVSQTELKTICRKKHQLLVYIAFHILPFIICSM